MGQVVHTLFEGERVAGVTLLADELYLLREERDRVVEVYDVVTYTLQRRLTVPGCRGFVDITSCGHYRCVYIGDHIAACVHRLDVEGTSTRWAVNDKPRGLSVNAARNVLVACRDARKIKEFSSDGGLIRQLSTGLHGDIVHPWHAIQLTNNQLVVCHGDESNALHAVCKLTGDGGNIIDSHGGQQGSDTGQYNVPGHLAVDVNDFVFVADINNQRVTLLSPKLEYVREVLSRDEFKWRPRRLYLDVKRRRLYVTDTQYRGGNNRSGRVVVCSV